MGYRRVYFLGAGFSRGAEFPLSGDILTTARTKLVASEICLAFDKACEIVAREEIASRAVVAGRTSREALQTELVDRGAPPSVNVEAVVDCLVSLAEFGKLRKQWEAFDFRDYNAYARVGAAYQAAITIRRTILGLLWDREESLDIKAVDKSYSVWARSLTPDDAVVTLNYDRLVERVLAQHDIPYHFGFSYTPSKDAVGVFKLHGSVDWVRGCGHHKKTGEPGNLFDGCEILFDLYKMIRGGKGPANPPGKNAPDRYRSVLTRIGNRNHAKGIGNDYFSDTDPEFIGAVPLGDSKEPSDVPGLGLVWNYAGNALLEADEVVVIGCALTSSEKLVRRMLHMIERERMQAGRGAWKVSHIDPDVTISSRILHYFGAESTKISDYFTGTNAETWSRRCD